MANQWLAQWIQMGEAQLSALQQLSQNAYPPAAMAFGNNMSMADVARLAKAGLTTWQQVNEINSDLCNRMFLQQIHSINGDLARGVRQSLMQLQESFSGQWAQQQSKLKSGVEESIQRCLDNLEQAQTRDDVNMSLLAFGNELNQSAKSAGGDTFGLLNSAHAAANIWLRQTLDQIIAGDEPAPSAEA